MQQASLGTFDRLAWGGIHRCRHDVRLPRTVGEATTALAGRGSRHVLGYGCGRSYGDSCLNDGHILIDTRRLDHLLGFDADRGVLRVQAGVRLSEIINFLAHRSTIDERSWYLPVSPGTTFVTVGGAIANDVHGKNHHRMGSFGHHVRDLRLLRGNGRLIDCSLRQNAPLFRATVGGLGLTGLIVEAEIQLRAVPGFALANEDIRFGNLDDFYALSAESEDTYEYTVAWVDCLSRGSGLGRGIFSRASHVEGEVKLPQMGFPRRAVPIELPFSPLNRFTVQAFNAVYWRKFWPTQRRRRIQAITEVLYPLDGIAHWNRLYGPNGFYQYQCVIPPGVARDAVAALLDVVARSGAASCLAVLKTMGAQPSLGDLSFPMPGTTLALDFANRGDATLALLDRLDAITREADGRIYPAKDARMPAGWFQDMYPRLIHFEPHIDPAFSSSFWRRLVPVPSSTSLAG